MRLACAGCFAPCVVRSCVFGCTDCGAVSVYRCNYHRVLWYATPEALTRFAERYGHVALIKASYLLPGQTYLRDVGILMTLADVEWTTPTEETAAWRMRRRPR